MTSCFIVEHERDVGPLNRSFSVKLELNTLSGNPSDVSDPDDYTESAVPPDERRHKPVNARVKSTIIESGSWQWLYATHLLLAFELIMTTKAHPLGSSLYSWLPDGGLVAFGWLLKNYWSPGTQLFSLPELQAASMLTRGDQPFAAITTMYGSAQNENQCQSSESSNQQNPRVTTQPGYSFISPLYSDSGGSNRDPQQDRHTLSLNCFVYPCHGVCRLRPSPDNAYSMNAWATTTEYTGPLIYCEPMLGHFVAINSMSAGEATTEHTGPPIYYGPMLRHLAATHSMSTGATTTEHVRPLIYYEPMFRYLLATNDDLVIADRFTNLDGRSPPEDTRISFRHPHFTFPTGTSETQQTMTGSSRLSQSTPHLSRTLTVQATNQSEQRKCGVTVVRNGQQRPCGKACKNIRTLSYHIRRNHSGQQTCKATMGGKDGQEQLCGKVCKNIKALSDHKRIVHSEKKTCDVTLVGEDGQPRPCGLLCKNAQSLSSHISRYHSGQKTCDVTVVGENGQPRPCGKICRNAGSLAAHKSGQHTGRRICGVIMIGEDGQQRPCGTLCKSSGALSAHKTKVHSGQKTCRVTVVGEDGQRQPCGTVCKNSQAMSNHRRTHRKRKPVDLDKDGDPSP
ncbi:hypothetical protein [Endozoicomonas sp. 8E]|uniref:hypothetical protein n=1 Tax=Endozoicomonas sp. 8E TaxID=3035692 RepID=UPI0029393B12|nr:hypothetical protein [Endozoicomonas sp. 8E]WOG27134.1 hypothetical protein P6910_21665 [Endozoicomonas sp. 8E]